MGRPTSFYYRLIHLTTLVMNDDAHITSGEPASDRIDPISADEVDRGRNQDSCARETRVESAVIGGRDGSSGPISRSVQRIDQAGLGGGVSVGLTELLGRGHIGHPSDSMKCSHKYFLPVDK